MSCFSCLPKVNQNNKDKLNKIPMKSMPNKVVPINPQQIENSRQSLKSFIGNCEKQTEKIISTRSIPAPTRVQHVQEISNQSMLEFNKPSSMKLQQPKDSSKYLCTIRLSPEDYEQQNDKQHNLTYLAPQMPTKRKLLSDTKLQTSERGFLGISILNTEPSSMKSQLSEQSKIICTPNSQVENIQHRFSQSDIKNLTDSLLDSILDVNLISSGENSFYLQKIPQKVANTDFTSQIQINSKYQEYNKESKTAKNQQIQQTDKKTAQKNENIYKQKERTLDQKLNQLLKNEKQLKSQNPQFQGESQSNIYDEPSDLVILGTPRVQFQY
eukprot:403333925